MIIAGFRLACHSPLCRYPVWSSLAVSELQLPLWLYHRAASLPSWIELNCLRTAAVGKAARLSIYWYDAACRLVIPLRQVALVQLYKNHQSGNAASGKLVWKQHKSKTNSSTEKMNQPMRGSCIWHRPTLHMEYMSHCDKWMDLYVLVDKEHMNKI